MKRTRMTTMLALLMIAVHPVNAADHTNGEQHRWTLTFRTRLEQPGGARPIEIALSGEWIATVSAVRAGEFDAALQFANINLSGPQAAKASELHAAEQRLERPFWITYRNDGAMVAMHFYKDTEPGDRNLLQMIATECQFVEADGLQREWTAGERDGAGAYTAAYRRLDGQQVSKRRVQYTGGAGVEIEQSDTRITLDAEGAIASLDSTFRARLGGVVKDSLGLKATTEVHLGGMRKVTETGMAGSLARAESSVEHTPIGKHVTDPAQLRARQEAEMLEGRSTESLLDSGFGRHTDQLLPDRLAALFRMRPEAATMAVERLSGRGPASIITDALGTAASTASIHALGAIAANHALPRALRIDALSAFILMQRPAASAMVAVSELMDDADRQVALAARMAAGSLARAGRASHPEEAAALDAALIARYRTSRDAEETVGLLMAMGNDPDRAVVPAIEDALRDRREAVRVAAARALRLAEGGEIDGLLAGTMTGDGDAGVRAAAIFAATFRNPLSNKLVNALLQVAKGDAAEQVRTSAIVLLRQRASAAAELVETLTWIAANDPVSGVRKLAQESLKGL